MKILLMHASAGAGHLKAAEAIYNCLKEDFHDFETKIVDILDFSGPAYKFVYKICYNFAVNHTPWIWGFFYSLTSLKISAPIFKKLNTITDLIFNRALNDFLINYNPDYIISPHFVPPEIALYLRRRGKINSKIITVITDLGIHPYWICKGTDLYVVHSQYAANQLIERGVEKSLIQISGIPVDQKFLIKRSREEMAAKFGIYPSKFTVLVATGSFGIGPIAGLIDTLKDEFQILVVCGRNARLYSSISKYYSQNVKVFEFVDNMEELMSCSDLIIAKAGGLTIAECLTVSLPPVFITAIPGQESQNIKVLLSNGAAIDARAFTLPGIKDLINDLKNSPERLNKIKGAMQLFKKPNAAKDLCNALR